MGDGCPCSTPVCTRPHWKPGVSACNTVKRFCGDTGWAIPEPDRPILVARVYQGTGCPVELVGTLRSWPILSPLKQKLGPLETFKAEPLWATPQKSSSSSESAVRLRERALVPWPEPLIGVQDPGLGSPPPHLIWGCTHRVDGGGPTDRYQSTFPRYKQVFGSIPLHLPHQHSLSAGPVG